MKKIPLWLLIFIAILFALVIVTFAIQNNTPVELVVAKWSFKGSMAIIFILSLGIGFLLSCMITLPLVLQKSVSNLNLKSKIKKLEKNHQESLSQRESSKEQTEISKEEAA